MGSEMCIRDRFYGGGINESEEGRSATVYPDQLAGITVELVQPYGAD